MQKSIDSKVAVMDVKRWITEGDDLFLVGEFARAEDAYSQAIKQEPNKALHHCKLGRVLLRQEQVDAAERCFEQALALNSESHLGLYGLIQVAEARGLWEETAEKCKLLVSLNPGFATKVYKKLANALEKLERREEAISIYKEAIAVYSSEPKLYADLGDIQHAMGDEKEAVSTYKEAIRLYQEKNQQDPKCGDSYRELGILQGKVGNFEAQIVSFKKAIEIDSQQHPSLYFNLADLIAEAGNFEESLAYCKESIKAHGNTYQAHSKAINILLHHKRIKEATRYATQELTGAIPDKEALVILGQAFFKTNQLSKSEAYFESLVEHHPSDYEGYEGLAKIYESCDRIEQAKRYWSLCFEKYPDHPKRFLVDLPESDERSETLFYSSVGESKNSLNDRTSPTIEENYHASEEATSEPLICPDLNDSEFIEFCFVRLLFRKPLPEALLTLTSRLKHMPRLEFLINILNGDEVKARQKKGLDLLPTYSDEDFIDYLNAIIFRAKPSEKLKENLLGVLGKGNLRSLVLANILNNSEPRLKKEVKRIKQKDRASVYHIVGQSELRYVEDWYKKFAESASRRIKAHQLATSAFKTRVPKASSPR